jgi:maltose-binding protein MalE
MSRTLLVLAALVLAACEKRDAIVLWHAHQGAEREALVRAATRWNTEHPEHPLELVGMPFNGFADKLSSAIPRGNGPDLFIYPQDRIGDWADAGVLEPIEFWLDDARADRFSPAAFESMAYRGSLWGLPLATKSLALYYRPDLVAEPPRTTDELIALTAKMKARDGYAVAYANTNLYGHAPWLFGFGGKLLQSGRIAIDTPRRPSASLRAPAEPELAIATPEAAAAMAFARELVAIGATPASAEGAYVATLFNEGKAATAISGPWFQADIAKGVPWKVTTLPVISASGKPAMPFLDAEGILMSSRAKDKDTAFAVMDALTSDLAAAERAQLTRQVVPNINAYSAPELRADPVLAAFRAQLEHAVAMPKDPAMRVVWTPYETALGEVLAGRAEPGPKLLAVEREVAGYLAGVK